MTLERVETTKSKPPTLTTRHFQQKQSATTLTFKATLGAIM